MRQSRILFVLLHKFKLKPLANNNNKYDMKRLIIAAFMLAPLAMLAQNNTWERPEVEEQKVEAKPTVTKPNPDEKYLAGAVPEKDGLVVFSKTINAPGKSAEKVYDILLKYLQKMAKEENQVNSQVAIVNKTTHEIGANYDEWLVFKANALVRDRTHLIYTIRVACFDNKADISIGRIRYVYGEGKDAQRYKAEEWISDKEALNKKQTKLLPLSGKFRRKTCDRMNYLFNKFESLLK